MNKYQVIYADPPWQYTFSKSGSRKIENQYSTMTIDDIKGLPIKYLAEKDCILYLWATSPKIIEALDVMKAWGFQYKTHCIWDKEIIGMGYWWRGKHELLLVGTMGKASPPEQALRDPSVYREKRVGHSHKPEHFRQRIDAYYPDKTKIELFARERVEGWDAWGDGVQESNITMVNSNE